MQRKCLLKCFCSFLSYIIIENDNNWIPSEELAIHCIHSESDILPYLQNFSHRLVDKMDV